MGFLGQMGGVSRWSFWFCEVFKRFWAIGQRVRKREFHGLKSTSDTKFSPFWRRRQIFCEVLDKNTLISTDCTDISSSTSTILLNFWKNFTKTVNFLSVFRKIMWKNHKLHLETPPILTTLFFTTLFFNLTMLLSSFFVTIIMFFQKMLVYKIQFFDMNCRKLSVLYTCTFLFHTWTWHLDNSHELGDPINRI